MSGPERRAAAMGARAAERLRARVAAAAQAALPGIRVEEAAGGVTLSGRGVARRVAMLGSAASWLG